MANPAYPDLPIDKTSVPNIDDGREEDKTGDGFTRIRKLHDDRYGFTVKHSLLTVDDVATLMAFYATNKLALIDFTWPDDGLVYQVRFGKGALQPQWVSPTRRSITVRLVPGI